jgi:prepilin-type N-terminal cleavage/methylation domain-containing protein
MFYMQKTHTKNISHQKGFTLLETLIAVFILTLALTGPVYIATLAIRSSVESRDNVSAYYLAEEAIEVIRNARDTMSLQNTISDTTWLTSITGGINCSNSKTASPITSCVMTRSGSTGVYTFTQCSGTCPALAFNPSGSIIYGQNDSSGATTISKFTREIYLQTAAQDTATDERAFKEIDLVVTVKWNDRGRNKQLKLVERLHNQQYAKYYQN